VTADFLVHQPTFRYLPMGASGEIIKDLVTGYEWQRCSVGQTWNATTQNCDDGTGGRYDWNTAMANWPATAAWRLPTVAELLTLVYCSGGKPVLIGMPDNNIPCAEPYLPPTIVSWAFPNTVGGDYWSSTPYALATDTTAWMVIFASGQSSTYAKNSYGRIRLVRGVQ